MSKGVAGVQEVSWDDDPNDVVSSEQAESLTDDVLAGLLDSDGDLAPEPEPEPDPEPEASEDEDEPESEPEDSDVSSDDEPTKGSESDDGAEGDGDEPDAGVVEPEVTQADLLKLQLEQYRSQAEHFRVAHDKLAGKYGELKKQFERSANREFARTDPDRGEYDGGEPAEFPRGSRLEREVEELRQYQRQQQLDRANQSLIAETHAFRTEHPEIEENEAFRNGLAEALKTRHGLVQEALESADADVVRRATRHALTDAYMEVKARMLEEQIARRSADQAANLKKRKKAAQVSGSTGKPKPNKRKVYNRPEDMPDDVLAAAIDAADD